MDKKYEQITKALKGNGIRFWANDNISEFVKDHKDELIDEATEAAEVFLRSLLIDVDTDPNSKETARRLAKMYYNEIMSGRYDVKPDVTAFPNTGDDAYEGMITVRAEIKSICSHHHKDVEGVAYISVVPNGKVIGLSKYIRIAQHCARRGTLQEQLTTSIADEIAKETGSNDVAVYIVAKHGCVSCRGVNQNNSNTQTTVLRGGFKTDPSVREEFFSNIKLQTSMEVRV